MEQTTRTNGWAMIGMVLAVLPIISIIFWLPLQYILMQFVAPRTLGSLLEMLGILLGVLMLPSYPLHSFLG